MSSSLALRSSFGFTPRLERRRRPPLEVSAGGLLFERTGLGLAVNRFGDVGTVEPLRGGAKRLPMEHGGAEAVEHSRASIAFSAALSPLAASLSGSSLRSGGLGGRIIAI